MATTTTSKKKTTTTTKSKKAPAKKPKTKKATKAAATKSTSTTKKAPAKKTTTKKVAAKKPAAKKAPAKVSKKSTALDVFGKLNAWNWVLALLHAAQGVAIILLGRDGNGLFPVSTTFMTQDTLASSEGAPVLVQAQRTLFDVNLAYLVAAFFFMSAIAHILVATVTRKKYEDELKQGINRARWYEYSLSASTMMVGIAMLTGVSDVSTLLMIFGATAVMNLCGLVMEVHNQATKQTNWLSYIVGTIAGIGPWAVVGTYLWGIYQYGDGTPPTFVLAIFASILVFFSSFAVNMYLQYRGKGPWSDYLFGEKAYMVLSLVAKSALAWQIFAGTLRP